MMLALPARALAALATLVPVAVAALAAPARAQAPRFEVTVSAAAHAAPLTGRLVLVLARDSSPEPRLLISPQGPEIAGVDLDSLAAGTAAVIDGSAAAYPTPLAALPAGDYFAQAVVNVYEPVRRADGRTLWLHMNDGTIEPFQIAAGNLFSEPRRVRVAAGGTIRLVVDRVNPPAERPADTEWVKHVSIRSERLTKFWGRPIDIHATVLLPRGYADHPEERYPTLFVFGHGVPFGFTTDSARARGRGRINPVTGLESGYDFYRSWVSDSFPRVIAVTFQQATPYFPDSYSVNSANNGPYGDAMVEEVIPFLEKRFRMIGRPYARAVEGASTNGWQSLALVLRYPDSFGGAWVLQPDPIDFHRYQLVDIYEDANAFTTSAGSLTIERPFRRTTEGQVLWTVRQLSAFEDVLGSRGRSGYQLEGWEAVYGPVGPDGYPVPLWDKKTGVINRDVARYMREHGYDLRDYAERNWATLGPKLAGKLHFFAGDMDDFYLNLAVYRMQDFLRSTTDPRSDAEFSFGRPMKGHGWHDFTWAEFVRRAATEIARHAPAPAGSGRER
ncbi:MAG TPA: alpha/beta hydrolase-fold protein [Longimicrobiales bacterium]|nr:alpha/beta hydrolase-fold protein [Longimicrobiales bacterium]